MKHISTRGMSPALSFDDLVLSGLAPDGGLYLPEVWPTLSTAELKRFRGQPYWHVAAEILKKFTGPDTKLDIDNAVHDAYAAFRHPSVAPIKRLRDNLFLLELFHGPTFAFKDFALQVLGRLIAQRLASTGRKLVVIAATSGDTGSAAIAALANRASVHIVVLHPKGRVSEIQRRQMTTVLAPNVHNIALEGDFDDTQALVKAMFNDKEFAAAVPLGAVNSINWVRLAIQTAYFVTASLEVGDGSPVNFVVPTGNFGDIFSGYVAKKMGTNIGRLVAATNANDIVARALTTGSYTRKTVLQTQSPSMDIQVASNFERLLFDASGQDAKLVDQLMSDFSQGGTFTIPASVLARIQREFVAYAASEAATERTMADTVRDTGELIDPHTATGLAAAQALKLGGSTVCLATAHPAKFGNAVRRAVGHQLELPPELAQLMTLPERCVTRPNDLKAIEAFITTQTQG